MAKRRLKPGGGKSSEMTDFDHPADTGGQRGSVPEREMERESTCHNTRVGQSMA